MGGNGEKGMDFLCVYNCAFTLGLVFLQYRTETKRALLPNEGNKLLRTFLFISKWVPNYASRK